MSYCLKVELLIGIVNTYLLLTFTSTKAKYNITTKVAKYAI